MESVGLLCSGGKAQQLTPDQIQAVKDLMKDSQQALRTMNHSFDADGQWIHKDSAIVLGRDTWKGNPTGPNWIKDWLKWHCFAFSLLSSYCALR